LNQNPILKVLSTMTAHQVKHLLMGGQACVFYGAAQFSRDIDLAIVADNANLDRLKKALAELQAEVIAVPPFEADYLARGFAVHFRCQHPDVVGFRIDVMSVMRDVDSFSELWERRTELEMEGGQIIQLMGIGDLVKAKKTQRDKDWPMIRALVDAHYEQHKDEPNEDYVTFWLREGRAPERLIEIGNEFPDVLQRLERERPFLGEALDASKSALRQGLAAEQAAIQELDRNYWKPLKQELENLRWNRDRKF